MDKYKIAFRKYKHIIIPVGVVVFVLAMVAAFFMAFARAEKIKTEELSRIDVVLGSQEKIESLLDAETIEQLSARVVYVDAFSNNIKKLLDYPYLCKGEREQDCKDIRNEANKISNFGKRVSLLINGMNEEGVSENDLKEMESGEYGAVLASMAEDIREIRRLVQEFTDKYSDVDNLSDEEKTQLILDYSVIEQYGEDLENRYKDKTFSEIYGYSREELVEVFETVKKLQEEIK